MLAFKGFQRGLICLGYHFQMGRNVTDQANCGRNGFHCAEDPLDCLSYYSDLFKSEYYLVDAGGDMDEDDIDSKISCTELTLLKRLTPEELLLHGLAYMADHPKRAWNKKVNQNRAIALDDAYAIVRGPDPLARGRQDSILAFAKEDPKDCNRIIQISAVKVDGIKVLPNVWYDADLNERKVS